MLEPSSCTGAQAKLVSDLGGLTDLIPGFSIADGMANIAKEIACQGGKAFTQQGVYLNAAKVALGFIPGGAALRQLPKLAKGVANGTAKAMEFKENADSVAKLCPEPSPRARPPSRLNPPRTKRAFTLLSGDPNIKVGAEGASSNHYISSAEPLRYMIHFENKAKASGAAQVVTITDVLDPSVDLNGLSLGPIEVAGKVVEPPPGVSDFTGTLDLRPANNVVVGVSAGFNRFTRVLSWQLTTLDPGTLQPTTDPVAGILPPGAGGSVTFTVGITPDLADGTQIANQADIVFDTNEVIQTPVWTNTIVNNPPVIQPVEGITKQAASSDGAVVDLPSIQATGAAVPITVTTSPASGSTFPAGTTPVTVYAVDAANNGTVSTFDVTVLPPGYTSPQGGEGSSAGSSAASGGGGGGGCFIATAAYGSYLHPHVGVLRDFRDRYLLTNAPGRRVVSAYYRFSPPVAGFIARHDSLRFLTRLALAPLVLGLSLPWILPVGVLVLVLWRRRRLSGGSTRRAAAIPRRLGECDQMAVLQDRVSQ